jgi:hypothetical protein
MIDLPLERAIHLSRPARAMPANSLALHDFRQEGLFGTLPAT